MTNSQVMRWIWAASESWVFPPLTLTVSPLREREGCPNSFERCGGSARVHLRGGKLLGLHPEKRVARCGYGLLRLHRAARTGDGGAYGGVRSRDRRSGEQLVAVAARRVPGQ